MPLDFFETFYSSVEAEKDEQSLVISFWPKLFLTLVRCVYEVEWVK
jgi:hypothetical protein